MISDIICVLDIHLFLTLSKKSFALQSVSWTLYFILFSTWCNKALYIILKIILSILVFIFHIFCYSVRKITIDRDLRHLNICPEYNPNALWGLILSLYLQFFFSPVLFWWLFCTFMIYIHISGHSICNTESKE